MPGESNVADRDPPVGEVLAVVPSRARRRISTRVVLASTSREVS
jgi:hypothetical protein